MPILRHGAYRGGQLVGIAVDQCADASLDHVFLEAGSLQARDQRRQMSLVPIHAAEQLGRNLERLGGGGHGTQLIDTHKSSFATR